MENFELYIEPKVKPYNPVNGRFLKGNIPFNKGLKWVDYMDMRKAKKVLKCLDIGRIEGNKKMPDINSKQIIGIKDGKLISFKNSRIAEEFLKAQGVKVNRRNISSVCNQKVQKIKCNYGRYEYDYIRRRAGGYSWFFAKDIDRYKDLIK